MTAILLQEKNHWKCLGDWDHQGVSALPHNEIFKNIPAHCTHTILIDGSGITHLDTAGALLLHQLQQQLLQKKMAYQWVGFTPLHLQLIAHMTHSTKIPALKIAAPFSFLSSLGMWIFQHIKSALELLAFVGEIFTRSFMPQKKIRWLRFHIFLKTVADTGYDALPIVGLLSFLIGIVLVYQLSVQLKQYNANIYIVNLLGLAVFREFGSLLTAVVAAGRTSASFTAEIGTMKIRQELDALTAMGIRSLDVLVLPKLLGHLVALPLLTIWANVFAITGGMIAAHVMLKISYADFLMRFQQTMTMHSFSLGLMKAPVFAAIIAVVGCFHGFAVGGSAESVGEQTTQSVVHSLFLIIVADAFFSVLFSWMGL